MNIQEQARLLVQSTSPRYERYDTHIRFLGRILAFLRRHRVLLSVLSGTVLALLLAFLSLIGSFFSEAHCQDFVYGEIPACDARAFLASTDFQFANLHGTPQWQQASPTSPGQYRIRAVSKNGFGAAKYSNEMTFTLLARELQLFMSAGSIPYGQLCDAGLLEYAQVFGLAPGDRISTAKWDIQLEDGPTAHICLMELRIEDSQGRDVTGCYQIYAPESYIPLLPQPITVTADNAEKLYDGTQSFDATAQITEGALAPGDQLKVRFDTPPAAAGTYELLPNCTIRSATGEDVTHLYRLTAAAGTLTVLPRPLTIHTGSAQKIYDTKPLKNSEWKLVGNPVLEGHTLQVTLSSQQTVVGTVKNQPSILILDEAGSDVTENYALNSIAGTLTVTPIVLKFETDSAQKVYDGKYLYDRGYRLVAGSLLPGHKMNVSTTGTQLHAGSSENGIAVSVYAANGSNITDLGYRIEVDPGMLTVTPRPITITSGSAEKLYDGMPLTYEQYTVTSGSLAQHESIYYWDFTGSQTQVGSSSNTFNIRISNGSMSALNVTYNYDISYVYGTLTVKPNPDYVPPGQSGSGESRPGESGSGESRPGESRPGVSPPGQDTIVGFPRGTNDTVYAIVYCPDRSIDLQRIYLRSSSYGNYTGSGWKAPELYKTEQFSPLELAGQAIYKTTTNSYLEISLQENCPILFPYYSRIFYNLDGAEYKNDCYFESKYSDLTYGLYWTPDPGYSSVIDQALSPEDAQAELEYRNYVYDTYLDVPDSTRKALITWAESQGIRSDSPTLITDIQRAVQNGATYNTEAENYPEGVDLAVHFLTKAKEGVCGHFATAATLLYRCYGYPARYTSGFMSNVTGGTHSNIYGHNAHAWVELYQPGVGWVCIEVTGSGIASTRPVDLQIKAASAIKYYDGMPFREQQLTQVTLELGTLLPGHWLEVTTSKHSNTSLPGLYTNKITSYRILDSNGRDVTNTYGNIRVLPGVLQIMRRNITVASGSAVKIEDGTPLVCSDYWLAQGSLSPGDRLEVEATGSIAYPGTQENTIHHVKILHTNPSGTQTDVTQYYNIHYAPGTLTVLPATSE